MAVLQWLSRAWAGIKTAASWIGRNPWTAIAIGAGWHLLRAIRRKRYEAGKMGPLAEKLYEVFSPLGDVADFIVMGMESVAWGQVLAGELYREGKVLVDQSVNAIGKAGATAAKGAAKSTFGPWGDTAEAVWRYLWR